MLKCAKIVALLGVMAFVQSCGGEAEIDLGNLSSSVSDTPRITAMKFVGQAPKASDVLIFEITFDDTNGDVGAGTLLNFINQNEMPVTDGNLRALFLQSELDPKAKAGTLRVTTQIAFLSAVQEGERGAIEVAFQLKDAKGHESNKVTARLAIEF